MTKLKNYRVLISETYTKWVDVQAEDGEAAQEAATNLDIVMQPEDYLSDSTMILDVEESTPAKQEPEVSIEPITSHKARWSYGDFSGTIEHAVDERGPTDIEWDDECPDNYEEIEDLIEQAF